MCARTACAHTYDRSPMVHDCMRSLGCVRATQHVATPRLQCGCTTPIPSAATALLPMASEAPPWHHPTLNAPHVLCWQVACHTCVASMPPRAVMAPQRLRAQESRARQCLRPRPTDVVCNGTHTATTQWMPRGAAVRVAGRADCPVLARPARSAACADECMGSLVILSCLWSEDAVRAAVVLVARAHRVRGRQGGARLHELLREIEIAAVQPAENRMGPEESHPPRALLHATRCARRSPPSQPR